MTLARRALTRPVAVACDRRSPRRYCLARNADRARRAPPARAGVRSARPGPPPAARAAPPRRRRPSRRRRRAAQRRAGVSPAGPIRARRAPGDAELQHRQRAGRSARPAHRPAAEPRLGPALRRARLPAPRQALRARARRRSGAHLRQQGARSRGRDRGHRSDHRDALLGARAAAVAELRQRRAAGATSAAATRSCGAPPATSRPRSPTGRA